MALEGSIDTIRIDVPTRALMTWRRRVRLAAKYLFVAIRTIRLHVDVGPRIASDGHCEDVATTPQQLLYQI